MNIETKKIKRNKPKGKSLKEWVKFIVSSDEHKFKAVAEAWALNKGLNV